MLCLADNRRMQQLARKFGAELSFQSGSVMGEVKAPRPTPMSGDMPEVRSHLSSGARHVAADQRARSAEGAALQLA
jgi:hypothetical protein